MKRLAALALALPFAVAACGDNLKPDTGDGGPDDPDAAVAIDAAIDAPAVTTYSGTISMQEVALLNPGNTGTLFGQGMQASIVFTSNEIVPPPMMEEMPGSPLGCKAWSYTPAQAAASVVGLNEGPVTFNATAGTVRPSFPACVHTAGVGYTCPELATASGGGMIGIQGGGPARVATLTDADVTFTAANSTGRYVTITGATNPANNGVFPILGVPMANTIVYGNQAAVAETLPAAATHVNLAAVGPTPMVVDPGFMSDDVAMTVDHAMGGGNHIPAFTATTAPGTVGDDFGILPLEAAKLNDVPLDGSAFTVACDTCGSASGTLINIVTTDAPLAGLSPFALPLPVTRRVQVRCAAIGQNSVTVPAAYSAALMGSGATRIQSTLIRPQLLSGGPASVNVIIGHALVGYTNPAN